MGKQRGRRVPPPMTPKQRRAMIELNEQVERLIREKTHAQPRGFIFWVNYDNGVTEPYVDFLRISDPRVKELLPEVPDLVELVQRYDPRHAFVLCEGSIDFATNQLRGAKIAEQSFFFPPPPGWSPNVAPSETDGYELLTSSADFGELGPVLERNIYLLAEEATRERSDKRGVLMVELDDAVHYGVKGAVFLSREEIRAMGAHLPAAMRSTPLPSYVESYDPSREYIVLLVDVSADLPAPLVTWKTLPIVKMT